MHLWKHSGTGYWYVKRPDGTRQSLKTRSKAEALNRLEDMKRAPQGALLRDAASHYLAEKRGRRSYEQMVLAWRLLEPFFGHLRHDQVTRQVCRAYTASRLKSGVKPGTVTRELGVMKAAVNYVHPKSSAQWEMPPSSPPRDRRLTKEEFKRLLDACEFHHVRLFCILALSTGGRKEALLQLTWDRVDFERRRIDLRTTAGHERSKGRAIVPMTEMAYEALSLARDLAQTSHVIEYGGQPIQAIKRSFAGACKRAGLEGVTPHVLRHTAATWMAEAGVSMGEIAAFLGHSDSRVTERVYAKFSPSFLHKAASALHI